MPKRLIAFVAVVLAGRMYLTAPVAEGQETATPIADAAARAATRAAPPPARDPMRPGLKWTGVGLIIGGGMSLVTTAMGGCRSSPRHCRNLRRVGYSVGAGSAGTGVLLLGMAHARRAPAGPALVIDGDRAILSQRVTF
jgi:hypothetical protein